MAMDNELRKILLREQDLRFVTDALGQYLGKKSEERKYYADQSQKERMAIEEARIKAASATEDIPEMEKFHYNIAEQDEWSEPFKAFVKDRGLNITGGEKGKLFDLSDKDSKIFQSWRELTLVDKPTTSSSAGPQLYQWIGADGNPSTGTYEEALKANIKPGETYHKIGTFPKDSEAKAPSTKEVYFTMPSTLNDNQRKLLVNLGYDVTQTGIPQTGLLTNEIIQELQGAFGAGFLTTSKPKDSEVIDYRAKVKKLIANRKTLGVSGQHEAFLNELEAKLDTMALDKDSYEMLRNSVKTYDDSEEKQISKVYTNLRQENIKKQKTVIGKYRSNLISGIDVRTFIAEIPGNEKQKLIDLYEKHEEYRYLEDDHNLNIITYGTEYNDKGVVKTLKEVYGESWNNNLPEEYKDLPATGTNLGWINLVISVYDGDKKIKMNDSITINGKKTKISEIVESPQKYVNMVTTIKENYAQNAANWNYTVPLTLLIDEPGIGGILEELLKDEENKEQK